MTHLLYCIYGRSAAPPPQECSGVFAIEAGELVAAASLWPDPPPPVDLGTLRTYEKIVAAFHASRTIIPLRYGCVVGDRSVVLDLLAKRQADYQRLLEELRGRVEMGLRLLGDYSPEAPRASGAGSRYLECARRRQTGLTAAEEYWTDRLCGLLSGLCARQKKEARSSCGARLLSLYFLIARGEVDRFRELVRQLTLPPDMKLLVSGPWPPYNFADDTGEPKPSDRDSGPALCAVV